MLALLRLFTRAIELVIAVPLRAVRVLIVNTAFNPRLGVLRYVFAAAFAYVVFAVVLVYVVAPIRGMVGAQYLAEKLRYDSERWVATAIYDANGDFVGTFDPRLDSQRDVNYTGEVITVGDYSANPDHKSIPVLSVPEHYWSCLKFHEDRYLGGVFNPYGIDLLGVLKVPYSTIRRSIALGRPSFGVGGSTLPMQFVRVIYKTPPRRDEGALEKLGRKLSEWWLAPVVYHVLTAGGDDTPLRQWAANHIWLAQRTGGAPLHGVEVTSRIVFGKEAKELTVAEQFVLASAVNKPIILLPGSDKLNAVRLDRWRYLAEVRASICATALLADGEQQKSVLLELVQLASGPPDPKVRPRLQAALERYAPDMAKRAEANPRLRANVLMPSARLGAREEMKQAFGFNWRARVRGISTTLEAGDNLAFRIRINGVLATLDQKWQARLDPGFTLDPVKGGAGREMPDVVVVAANQAGEIVRYYESSENAPYFGAVSARDPATGRYDPARDGRAIASTGKIIAAMAIANQGRDTSQSPYIDADAPAVGLETCRDGGGLRRGRLAEVAFACSLSRPVEWRTAQAGQRNVAQLIEKLGFSMPPAPTAETATPPSTAAARGLIGGAPRRVQQMSAVVLAALTGHGNRPVPAPSLIKAYDFTGADDTPADQPAGIVPNDLIRPGAHALLRVLLQAPLCYTSNGQSHGTLKSLSHWCAARRAGVRLHIAKTGTQVNEDPDATVDVWITGGIQFASGAAYSYVVLVGTGNPRRPFARALHAAQVAPLAEAVLEDLEQHARTSAAVASRPAAPADSVHTPRVADNRPGKTRFSVEDFFSRLSDRSR